MFLLTNFKTFGSAANLPRSFFIISFQSALLTTPNRIIALQIFVFYTKLQSNTKKGRRILFAVLFNFC